MFGGFKFCTIKDQLKRLKTFGVKRNDNIDRNERSKLMYEEDQNSEGSIDKSWKEADYMEPSLAEPKDR